MLVRHVSDAKIHVFSDSDKRRLERLKRFKRVAYCSIRIATNRE